MLDRAEDFIARERVVQRVGVGAMCLFVFAGAVGLFGQGALSHRHSTSGNLSVEYERYSRLMLRSDIVISARLLSASATPARISIDKSFLDAMSIEETRPQHVEMEIQDRDVVFVVPAVDGTARLELHLKPQHPGPVQASIRLEGDSPAAVDVRQFVFF